MDTIKAIKERRSVRSYKSVGIQEDYEGIGVCIIGYANGEYPETKPRRENRVYKID